MREFQERKKIQKKIFSPFALAALLILFLFLTVSTAKMYLKRRAAAEKNRITERQLVEIKEKNAEMKKEIERLRSDFGKEAEIRKKFNVQKPGEKVIVIVDKVPEKDKINPEKKESGFFSGIFRAIKNIF